MQTRCLFLVLALAACDRHAAGTSGECPAPSSTESSAAPAPSSAAPEADADVPLCSRFADTNLRFGERTRLVTGTRYHVADTSIVLCLRATSRMWIMPADRARHGCTTAMTVELELEDGKERLSVRSNHPPAWHGVDLDLQEMAYEAGAPVAAIRVAPAPDAGR